MSVLLVVNNKELGSQFSVEESWHVSSMGLALDFVDRRLGISGPAKVF